MPRKKEAPAPAPDDYSSYRLLLDMDADLDDEAEWFREYITDIRGAIVQQWCSDDHEDVLQRVVGTIEGWRFEIGRAMQDGQCIVEAADDHSADAYNYCLQLFEPGNLEYRDQVQALFPDDALECDALAIHEMQIEPEHRGRGLGLRAMLRTLQAFGGGCGVALIKPWPLQYTGREFDEICRLGKTAGGRSAADRRRDFSRLRRYWSRLGFVRIPDADYYVRPFFVPWPDVGNLVTRRRPRR